jgi:hypothetical protein
MSTHPLLSVNLKNGLTLLGWDQLRKIDVDRWTVCVMVEMTIPVEIKGFVNHPMDDEKFRRISGDLGDSVVFKQKKERPFIRADQKEQRVKDICDSVEETGVQYIGHDDFAAKYILRVFADQQRRRHG